MPNTSLDVSVSSVCHIAHGSHSSLDNLDGTWLFWVFLNGVSNDDALWRKPDNNHLCKFTTSRIDANWKTTGTQLQAAATRTNFAHYGTGKWLFIVIQHNRRVALRNKIFMGDLLNRAEEPSSYNTQSIGTGTFVDDSAADLIVGDDSTSGRNINGDIAYLQIYNRNISKREIWALQANKHLQLDGCVLHCLYGTTGAGIQRDLSKYSNHGTVTNAVPGIAAVLPVGVIQRRSIFAPAVASGGVFDIFNSGIIAGAAA